jgi:single-stranded-DNA-specific exonuclease
VLCATEVEIAETPKLMGRSDRHLSMKIKQHHTTMRAIAFGHGDWLEDLLAVEGTIDIAYRPVINEYRGRRNVEMHLVDWRLSQQPALIDSV